jgi:hypothetical protein
MIPRIHPVIPPEDDGSAGGTKSGAPVGEAVLEASVGRTKSGAPAGEAVLEVFAGGTIESGARPSVLVPVVPVVPVVPFCANTDVTRYEIENKENIINANDKRVILFIKPPLIYNRQ